MKSKNKFKNIKENEIWNAENIYHLKTNISRIGKLIYHYEIYKKIIECVCEPEGEAYDGAKFT